LFTKMQFEAEGEAWFMRKTLEKEHYVKTDDVVAVVVNCGY